MPFSRQILRYYCSRCSSLLKESPLELAASPADICPQCGSFLSETLRYEEASGSEQVPAICPPKNVFDLSVPGFGIPAIDWLGQKYSTSVCLVGQSSELLFWRALVRSLLPRRAGGSGFSRVLLVDAGNCSDIYLCVDFARQMGLSLNTLLDGIVVTRAFTVYQLTALATNLKNAVRKFDAQLVAVADMAKLFASDPQVADEELILARKIAGSLSEVSKHIPVMAFMASFRCSDWLAAFENVLHTRIEGTSRLIVTKRGNEVSATMKESDALYVRQQR